MPCPICDQGVWTNLCPSCLRIHNAVNEQRTAEEYQLTEVGRRFLIAADLDRQRN
jgi:hypothetical protein